MGADRVSSESRLIARVLQGGLAIAVITMLAGVVVAASSGSVTAARMTPFDAAMLRDPGSAITMFGILVLAATPAIRVAALVVVWAKEGDRRSATVALVVAVVLVLAALLGHG